LNIEYEITKGEIQSSFSTPDHFNLIPQKGLIGKLTGVAVRLLRLNIPVDQIKVVLLQETQLQAKAKVPKPVTKRNDPMKQKPTGLDLSEWQVQEKGTLVIAGVKKATFALNLPQSLIDTGYCITCRFTGWTSSLIQRE